MSVDYEYDFTTGLYRARVKTKYKRADMSMSDWIYSDSFEFRKYSYYIFKSNRNIIVDPNTLTAINATLIEDAIDPNYYGFSYRKYDNGLYIIYDAPIDKCGFSAQDYPDAQYIYYDPNVVFNALRMDRNFGNSENIKEITFGTRVDLSKSIQLQTMFSLGRGLKYINLDNLNLSPNRGPDIYSMFYNCNSIEKIDLSKCLKSKRISSCYDCFLNCHNLKYLNLNGLTFTTNWTMEMLTNCYSLVEIKGPLGYLYPDGQLELPFTMYDEQGNSYTKLPGGNITLYATNPTL